MTDTSIGSEQVETDTDPLKSRLLAVLSLVLVGIFCFELDWFNNNIYRYAPWIEVIKPEHVDVAVNWIFGFFLLSVGTAFLRGKLRVLQEPSRFLGKDHFNFLSHWLFAVVVSCSGVAVFAIIVLNPAVHLDYADEGEKPTVIRNGNAQHFNDTTIFLSIDPLELHSQNIEITDRHGLYRIKLVPSDATNNPLLFSKHARIDLQKFLIKRDFKAELSDANDRALGSFEFSYENTVSLREQCSDSEPGFEKRFSDGKCDRFFRKLFRKISSGSGRMFKNTTGSFFYDNRKYNYRYDFGPTIEISITAPMAASAFGNKPLEAFDLFLNAKRKHRENLVDEFRKDIEVISITHLGGIFESLASPAGLSKGLDGTVAVRQASLSFVKDVLALGVDHLTQVKTQQIVEQVAVTNLKRVDGKRADRNSILLAVDTILALTQESYALDRLEAFVRDLGTDNNVLKPHMVGILLRHFDDSMDHNEATRIVSIVGKLWQTARGVKSTTDGIRTEVSNVLKRLSNNDLRNKLREFDKRPMSGQVFR